MEHQMLVSQISILRTLIYICIPLEEHCSLALCFWRFVALFWRFVALALYRFVAATKRQSEMAENSHHNIGIWVNEGSCLFHPDICIRLWAMGVIYFSHVI